MSRRLDVIYGAVGGAIVGGAVTYMFTNARLKKAYEAAVDADIKSVKEHYSVIKQNATILPLEDDEPTESYTERLADLGYVDEVTSFRERLKLDTPPPGFVTFVGTPVKNDPADIVVEVAPARQLRALHSDEDIDEDEELDEETKDTDEPEVPARLRDLTMPFVISIEEFMDDEPVHDKITITYFEGDDTLCDEREAIIPDVLQTIGLECLTQFGHKSQDKNIVYVRNMRTQTDFEVVLDERGYAEIILGIRPPKEAPRRFKERD